MVFSIQDGFSNIDEIKEIGFASRTRFKYRHQFR